jgi:hypothetical protein
MNEEASIQFQCNQDGALAIYCTLNVGGGILIIVNLKGHALSTMRDRLTGIIYLNSACSNCVVPSAQGHSTLN